jgi:hypothetical protein
MPTERNCVELIMKLRQLNLVELIFTQCGKEYLTPLQLKSEIAQELKDAGVAPSFHSPFPYMRA